VCVYVPLFLQLPAWSAWSPPTRIQAQVTLNKKLIQTTQLTFLSKGEKKKKERRNTTLKLGKRRPQAEQVREKKMKKKTEKQHKWKNKWENHNTK